MTDTPRKTAAAVAWNWADRETAPAPRAPSRVAAVAQAAVALAVATWLMFFKKHVILGAVLYGVGTLVLVGGLFIPALHRAIQRGGVWLGRIVGQALTWLLLMPFFYLCFPPARLILWLRGKDPLRRRWDPSAASYWTDRPPVEQAAHYARPY